MIPMHLLVRLFADYAAASAGSSIEAETGW